MVAVGRAVWNKKATTSDCLNLDMTYLARQVRFDSPQWRPVYRTTNWGRRSSIGIDVIPPDRLRFRYTSTYLSAGEKIDRDYNVFIESTPCNYGGQRWWFECPRCHRRCRVLYDAPGHDRFICRICGNLTYESQQEGKTKWSALLQAIIQVPKLEHKYFRSRSPRKRAILMRKLHRLGGGMESIINWGEKHK